MSLYLRDPVTGAPTPIRGVNGKPSVSGPADASAITPDNATIYTPPISITIWDAAAAAVTVVPYGMKGDPQITYPTHFGMQVPVLVKKVLVSGTTAAIIRGQTAYVAGGATQFGHLLAEGGGSILTENSTPLQMESGS